MQQDRQGDCCSNWFEADPRHTVATVSAECGNVYLCRWQAETVRSEYERERNQSKATLNSVGQQQVQDKLRLPRTAEASSVGCQASAKKITFLPHPLSRSLVTEQLERREETKQQRFSENVKIRYTRANRPAFISSSFLFPWPLSQAGRVCSSLLIPPQGSSEIFQWEVYLLSVEV